MEPRTPAHRARWKSLGPASAAPGSRAYKWRYLQVLSGFEAGEWHLSVSSLRMGTVSDEDLAFVRAEFGMQDAIEERAHLRRSRVRHLWLPMGVELAS